MNRRTFLKTISLIPLLGAGNASHATTKRAALKTPLNTHPVAGFQFYDGENIWSQLTLKAPVTLCREPDNPYDEKAILVHWKNQKLGYLPRKHNASFAALMDEGKTLSAEIATLSNSYDPWQRIEIAIYQEVTV